MLNPYSGPTPEPIDGNTGTISCQYVIDSAGMYCVYYLYMKRLALATFGSLILLSTMVRSALAQTYYGIEFDPEGKIKKATKLTDESPENITVNVIQWALGFLGLAAVVMILWGGITWMTSAGNEEKVRKAKDILRAAIIGLIVVLLSWALVRFVVNQTGELAT